MPNVTEPKNIILDFLENLPDTIRDNVFCVISLWLETKRITKERDYKKDVYDYLMPDDENERAIRSILVCACIDHHLTRGRSFDHDRFTATMDETKSPTLMALARMKPLQDKHFQIAALDWLKLRDGPLSLRSLQEFERRTWELPQLF